MTSIQEDVHYDGGPARGDLIFNILLGFTLIGLPFTIGAVVRAFGCASASPVAASR